MCADCCEDDGDGMSNRWIKAYQAHLKMEDGQVEDKMQAGLEEQQGN